MPDLASPVEFSFILVTIGVLITCSIAGIVLVKLKKV